MRVVLFVVVVVVVSVVAAISVTAQPAKLVVVQIVRGTAADLKNPCSLSPTDVFVVGNQAYHCIDKKLLAHAEAEKNSTAVVQLSAGGQIQWKSSVPFTVVRVERHGALGNGTPNDPFSGNVFSDKPSNTVTSGTVVNLEGNVQQRYKATFLIEGVLVDPDFNCSM